MGVIKHLIGPRLKLARAKKHLGELEALLDAFASDTPHRLVIEEDVESGGGINLSCVHDRPIPIEIAGVIGDVVHNLRSALDHLVSGMIRASGNTTTRNNGFPIFKDRAGYNGGVTSKLFGADDVFRNFVIGERSFEGEDGNGWYYQLSKLDNDDKHIILMPIASAISISHLVLGNDEGASIKIQGMHFPGPFSHGITLAPGTPNLKVQSQGEPVIGIFLDQGTVLEGLPVVESLKELAGLVGDVISSASPLFRV